MPSASYRPNGICGCGSDEPGRGAGASQDASRDAARNGGVETAALRYFNVFGLGRTRVGYSGVIAQFMAAACSGTACTIYGPTAAKTRDFVFVSDVVSANFWRSTHPEPSAAS